LDVKVIVGAAVVIVLIVGAALFLAGGGAQEQAAQATATTTPPPLAGLDLLTIGVVADQLVTDPAAAANIPSFFVISLSHDTLVKIDPATGRLEPGLAVSWNTPDNGLTWVFTLRTGVSFPDGAPFNASVVVKSFHRLMAVQGPYSKLASAFIDRVEAVNDTVVRFVLRIPVANFPQMLATPLFAISHPAHDLFRAEPQSQLSGIGPYVIAAASHTSVVLERNPDYYRDFQGPEKIVVRAYLSSSDLLQAALDGDVLVAWWGLNSRDAAALEERGFRLTTSEPLVLKLLALRLHGSPLEDPELRLAVAKAIDQSALADAVPGDYDLPAYSIIPSPLLGYTEVFKEVGGDPEGAKAILEGKGYAPDNPLVLRLVISTDLNGEIDAEIAAAVKAQLEATGLVKVEVSDLAAAAFMKVLRQGDFDLALVTVLPVYPDPTFYVLQTMYSRTNLVYGTGYANPQVDTLIENVLATIDYTVREEAFQTIQKVYLARDLPYVPLVELEEPLASSPQLPEPLRHSANLMPIIGW